MATVINNPSGSSDRIIERDSSNVGWAVAVVVLIVVLAVGFFVWYRYYHAPVPQSGGTNINVTLPTTGNSSGGTSGGTTY